MTRPVKPVKKPKRAESAADEPRDVTRYVSPSAQAILWGRAAGRCEFGGCNLPLWRSPVTQESVNIAQKAHIYSFSPEGPRGNAGVAARDLNAVENLILVCPVCHLKIDQAPDGGRYSVVVVRGMKARHEERVELVTGIAPEFQSHVLVYGANIGEHHSPRLVTEAAAAMFPGHYPAEAVPVSLGTLDSPVRDDGEGFWESEGALLRTHFERRVRDRLAAGGIKHVSVFALAPQPLLVQLGTLLGDITPADVYQRHREPASWSWPTDAVTPDFVVHAPAHTGGPPALLLAISATVTPDRIEAVLGADASIWTITVPEPRLDLTKSRDQMSRFRTALRGLLDLIKAAHGQDTPLHVFPAVSAAMAVELGRVRMPKADTPWHVYDQVGARRGFIRALSIPHGERA